MWRRRTRRSTWPSPRARRHRRQPRRGCRLPILTEGASGSTKEKRFFCATKNCKFSGIADLQALLAADRPRLLKNLAEQLTVYATGRGIAFSDRTGIAGIVERTHKQGGGI